MTAARLPLGRRAVLVLGVPTVLVVLAHVAAVAWNALVSEVEPALQVFGVGQEHNVPSWWNTVLLLSVAFSALLLAVLTPPGRKPSATVWVLAGLGTTYLAADEALSIHERLAGPGLAFFDLLGVSAPKYVWVVPGAALALVGVALGVRWFLAVPRDVRLGLMLAGATYLTGALVVEAFNGMLFGAVRHEYYLLSTGVEELLEMAGCVIATASILRLVDVDPVSRTARLRGEAAAPPAGPAGPPSPRATARP